MPDEMMNRLPAFHQKPSVAEVEQRAMALWPGIAADAGLSPDGAALNFIAVGLHPRVGWLVRHDQSKRRASLHGTAEFYQITDFH